MSWDVIKHFSFTVLGSKLPDSEQVKTGDGR